jgi:YbaB/EbfC DNA-binding family protein
VSDALHANLADIQASLTASCVAQSPDGTVRAEATAKRQLALELSPAALTMRPDDLAALILATQREAQHRAETAIAERLDAFRADPRVAVALDKLRDTQAVPEAPPRPAARPREDDADFAPSVYDKNEAW